MGLEIMQILADDPEDLQPGGVTYVMSLVKSLLKMGHEVTIIGIKHPGSSNKSLNYRFIPVYEGKQPPTYKFLIKLIMRAPALKLSANSIVHCHGPEELIPFIISHRKIPKICTLHGLLFRAVRAKKSNLVATIYEIVENLSLRFANKIIAVDNGTKESYLQRYPWLKDRITVIPAGVDLEKFKPMNKASIRKIYGFAEYDKIILFVGRLEKEKRVDLLIRAFKIIKEKLGNAKLTLVGTGREKNKLEKLIKDLELEDVFFMGVFDQSKIPEIINCADVFALCSLYEGSPIVVREALACGIPVVSSDVGDIRETIENGKTGYVLSNSSEIEFADRLMEVLKNANVFREECGRAAQRYSWENIVKKNLEVYLEAKN